MNNKNLSLPVSIIIAGLIIAGTIYYTKKTDLGLNDQQDNQQNQEIKDHILGNPDAQLTFTLYTDMECPFCKRFHYTLKQMIEEYGKDGKVNLVFRHFPLDTLHSKARKEAQATECAAQLGGNEKFWQYVDKIFEITPSNNGLDLAELPKISEQIGLDKAKFTECLDKGATSQIVQKHYEKGLEAGARGTPHFLITGKRGEKFIASGAFPYYEKNSSMYEMLSDEEKKVLCKTKEGIECGIKVAIDNLLSGSAN